jgi:TonB family protein
VPGGQEDPNFSTEEPTILSDTKGYDFGPYMNQVINRVRYNWYSLIPEIARLGKKGRVVIIFTITQNGTIDNAHIVANSGTEPLDRAAFGSITASNPFAKLPSGFDGDRLVLQFTFLYNIR